MINSGCVCASREKTKDLLALNNLIQYECGREIDCNEINMSKAEGFVSSSHSPCLSRYVCMCIRGRANARCLVFQRDDFVFNLFKVRNFLLNLFRSFGRSFLAERR